MDSTVGSSLFFRPRLCRERYERGWEGYRTLVLGVFFVCEREDCPFRDECLRNTAQIDEKCPAYAGMDASYYRLSNSAQIEVDSFLEGSARYPTYSSITKYLLQTNLHVPDGQKEALWDSIAFANFLQNHQASFDTLDYARDSALLDASMPAFLQLLEQLSPELLYVFDTAVADCLRAHNIPGLEYVDYDDGWTLPVHRFLYRISAKMAPADILASISKGRASRFNHSQAVLREIIRLRKHSANPKENALTRYVRPHIWDKDFEQYLYLESLHFALSPKQKEALHRFLTALCQRGFIRTDQSLIFSENLPVKLAQYEKDGLIVELFNWLARMEGQDKLDISEWNFARALGVSCTSDAEWRTIRKKEYAKHCDASAAPSRLRVLFPELF